MSRFNNSPYDRAKPITLSISEYSCFTSTIAELCLNLGRQGLSPDDFNEYQSKVWGELNGLSAPFNEANIADIGKYWQYNHKMLAERSRKKMLLQQSLGLICKSS